MFKDPVKALLTIFLISAGLRLAGFPGMLGLSGGANNRSGSSPATARVEGDRFQPNSAQTYTTQSNGTPADGTSRTNADVIESFQTRCHIVEVYRRDNQVRLSVVPRSDSCGIVSGDYPAVASGGDEGTEYRWDAQNGQPQTVQARVFIPQDNSPRGLDLTGPGVPDGTKTEYEGQGDPPPNSAPDPDTDELTYEQGYDRGYSRGYQDGQTFRQDGLGYNPDEAFQSGSQSGDPDYDQGFRDGFYDGFNSGYYNFEPVSPQPAPFPFTLVCVGNVDISDFTAYYTQESGFSRVEFRPRSGGTLLTANLVYAGENQQGQAIWRGNVNAMASVTLLHLSSGAVRPGDAVSVNYDGQWGRGTCRSTVSGWW